MPGGQARTVGHGRATSESVIWKYKSPGAATRHRTAPWFAKTLGDVPASALPHTHPLTPTAAGDLPCVCYRDAEDLHGVKAFHRHFLPPPSPPPLPPWSPAAAPATAPPSPPTYPNGWATTLDLFSPEYAASCAAEVNATLALATADRASACGLGGNQDRQNVQTWRFGLAALIVALMGLTALLAVRPARQTPVSLADAGTKPLSLNESLKAQRCPPCPPCACASPVPEAGTHR